MAIVGFLPARRAAAAASRTAATAWWWLTTPVQTYPSPPVPDDRNIAGLGWTGGSKPLYRPFCDHKHWNFAKDGRRCTCGALMVDPGD